MSTPKLGRPRTSDTGPLAQMTPTEVGTVAEAVGRTVATVDRWRRGVRPSARLSDQIAELLCSADAEKWGDPVALARAIREWAS
jgi:hypothetical protein